MTESSLSGDTTSLARHPNEFVAHSRKGDSEPGKLFFPSLRGVAIQALIEELGLRMLFANNKPPSAPDKPHTHLVSALILEESLQRGKERD